MTLRKKCAVLAVLLLIAALTAACQKNETPVPFKPPSAAPLETPDNNPDGQAFYQASMEQGEEHYENRKYAEAAECFQKAINLSPEQYAAHIRLSETCLQLEDKGRALQALEEYLSAFPGKDAPGRRDVGSAWMRAMLWISPELLEAEEQFPGIPETHALSDVELLRLSQLAYIMAGADAYLFPGDLTKEDILSVLDTYYSSDMHIPARSYRSWERLEPPVSLNADGYLEKDDLRSGYSVSAEKADYFAQSMLGVPIPAAADDYENFTGDLRCEHGVYEIMQGDYMAATHLVSYYRYLGEDIFLVLFDADNSGLPGPYEAYTGIIPDAARMLVKRTDSPWGFTIIANLHSMWGRNADVEYTLPGMISVRA